LQANPVSAQGLRISLSGTIPFLPSHQVLEPELDGYLFQKNPIFPLLIDGNTPKPPNTWRVHMSAQDSYIDGLQSQKLQQNIKWHAPTITRDQRSLQNGHRSVTLWFTGLSGAGKSTVAHAVEDTLYSMGCRTFVFDGDNVRHGLCAGLGFSADDRRENMRRVGEAAKLFSQAGVISLAAFISPYRKDRELVRNVIGGDDFLEIYCSCPIETCEERDVKGLYRKARAGEIKEFTGISSPYEAPENPDLTVDTSTMSLQECVNKVIDLLVEKKIVARSARAKAKAIEAPFIHTRESANDPAKSGYADFEDLVEQVRNNDPSISSRIMEPDGYFQTRRTTLTEIGEAVSALNAKLLSKRSSADLPTLVFAWGKCRVGSTALTNLFGIANILAYYNPIKTAVRHFALDGPGEAWDVPQRDEHKFVFAKEMSGPYHLADCVINPLQILVEAGYPTDRIELLVLDRDPYKSLDSWFNKFGDRILPERLSQHYVLSALNSIRVKAYAAKVGIRTSHYVYEASRIPGDAVSRMFDRLGVSQHYNCNVVENWNEKGALASKESKIIFPPAPKACTTDGLHASETRYLYKERSADRVSPEYRELIERTGVLERYREAALFCAAELDMVEIDRRKMFAGTLMDIGGTATKGDARWQSAGTPGAEIPTYARLLK
jgi:adenylylsulfate kinase